MRGLSVVRILLFFSFVFNDKTYPCALVCWFSPIGEEHDEDTGMWMVQPEVEDASAKPFFNLYNFRQLFHAFTTCN